MTTEAETQVIQLQTKDCQGTPAATRCWKRRGRVLPQSFRGSRTLPTAGSRIPGLQNGERINSVAVFSPTATLFMVLCPRTWIQQVTLPQEKLRASYYLPPPGPKRRDPRWTAGLLRPPGQTGHLCRVPGVRSTHLHPEHLLPTPNGIVLKRKLVLPDHRAALLVPRVGDHVEVRRPHLKLTFPVDDGGQGRTDQVGPLGVALGRETDALRLPAHSQHRLPLPSRPAWASNLLVQGVEEDDGLDCLAQTHLIGQDGVGALGPGKAQPVKALQLVRVQCAARGVDVPRLLVKLDRGLQGGRGSDVPWILGHQGPSPRPLHTQFLMIGTLFPLLSSLPTYSSFRSQLECLFLQEVLPDSWPGLGVPTTSFLVDPILLLSGQFTKCWIL